MKRTQTTSPRQGRTTSIGRGALTTSENFLGVTSSPTEGGDNPMNNPMDNPMKGTIMTDTNPTNIAEIPSVPSPDLTARQSEIVTDLSATLKALAETHAKRTDLIRKVGEQGGLLRLEFTYTPKATKANPNPIGSPDVDGRTQSYRDAWALALRNAGFPTDAEDPSLHSLLRLRIREYLVANGHKAPKATPTDEEQATAEAKSFTKRLAKMLNNEHLSDNTDAVISALPIDSIINGVVAKSDNPAEAILALATSIMDVNAKVRATVTADTRDQVVEATRVLGAAVAALYGSLGIHRSESTPVAEAA